MLKLSTIIAMILIARITLCKVAVRVVPQYLNTTYYETAILPCFCGNVATGDGSDR